LQQIGFAGQSRRRSPILRRLRCLKTTCSGICAPVVDVASRGTVRDCGVFSLVARVARQAWTRASNSSSRTTLI
jgi:hypothetical protein